MGKVGWADAYRATSTSPRPSAPSALWPPTEATPKGAYIPLGLGPRVFRDQHFAMLEMTLLADIMLQRFELHWPDGAAKPVPQMHVR
jgi:cytochrome P450